MTPREKVREVFPRAHCYEWAGPAYVVYSGDLKIVRGKPTHFYQGSLNVSDPTRRAAWAAAARNLTERRKG